MRKRKLIDRAYQTWFRFRRPMTMGVRGVVVDAEGRLEGGSASISNYEWDYGDGVKSTTSTSPHVYTYATAGTYTPVLRILDTTRNLSSSKTGTAIVITTSRVIERPGVMDVIRTTMPTSGSEKNATVQSQ